MPDEPGRIGKHAAPAQQEIVVVPHPADAPEPPRLTRGFRIGVDDLRAHGYTQQCPKCDAVRVGRSVGTGHSSACRERLRIIFTGQEDGRVERAEGRRVDAVDNGVNMAVEPEDGPGADGDVAMGEAAQEGMSDDEFVPLPPGEGDLDPEQFLPTMAVETARLLESSPTQGWRKVGQRGRTWADMNEDSEDDAWAGYAAERVSVELAGTSSRQ